MLRQLFPVHSEHSTNFPTSDCCSSLNPEAVVSNQNRVRAVAVHEDDRRLFDETGRVVTYPETGDIDPGSFHLVHFKSPEPRRRRKRKSRDRQATQRGLVPSKINVLNKDDVDVFENERSEAGAQFATARNAPAENEAEVEGATIPKRPSMIVNCDDADVDDVTEDDVQFLINPVIPETDETLAVTGWPRTTA